MEFSGSYAVFDGIRSPVTQFFGFGIFEELNPASLGLLCSRQHRPIAISNVMYRSVEKLVPEDHGHIRVRVKGSEEAQLWTGTSAKGWTREQPELLGFFYKPPPSLQHVSRARASSRVRWSSGGRRPFQNCAVAGCKQRSFKSVCDTLSITAAR
jgi:hypothetical protein